jgi:perosamine synthetase
MQRQINDPKSLSGRREFLRSAGAAAAGLYLAGKTQRALSQEPGVAAKPETLAVNGGPETVTAPLEPATRWPLYGEDEEKEVLSLIRNPNYGPIAEFEKAWSQFHNMPYCKAHCNGTSALTSVLFALDLPPGSEILVPSRSTWFPVVPMRFFGLVPVWVDVHPRTMNIDVDDCKRRLTKNTKAILPVHWLGLPCDMDHICDFAHEHGLEVVEDCSHSHGASLKGRLTGTWGRMSGFSLQATKPLPAIEGGIGMYKSRSDYERAVTYGNYDLPGSFPEDSLYRKYQGAALGGKLRMHPVAAILAKTQLKHLVERNAAGVAQMKRLNDRLCQLSGLTIPDLRPGCQRVYYWGNTVFIDPGKAGMSREACVKALTAEGVQVSEYNWPLAHTFAVFQEAKWWHHPPATPAKLPGSDEANRTAMMLPYFTSEQPELVDQYVKAFEKVWAHRQELA